MKTELIEKLEEAKKGLAYCNTALSSNLEKWERKEYDAVKNDFIQKIESLEFRLKTYF